MKAFRLAIAFVSAVFVFAPVGEAAINTHVTGGLEYHFVNGDTDNSPGVYANCEIKLPEPISVMVGVSYFGGDYQLRDLHGSYSSIGLEALMLVTWDKVMWRPYVGVGGAQYFNSFDNADFPDKLGMIYEAGTHLQVTDNLKAQLAIRYATLRPDHLDPRIGEIVMDAVILRAGLVFDF